MASPANLQHDTMHERLFEHARDVMLVHDLDGRVLRLNAAGRALFGLGEDDVAETQVLDLVHPTDSGTLRERLTVLRAGGTSESRARVRARAAGGSHVWLETRTTFDAETQLLYVVARDLSGSEDADAERLIESYTDAPLGMALVTPDGRFRRANPALCRLLGRTMEELLDCTIFEVVADEQAALADWSRERLQTGERSGFQAETRLRRPDGRVAVALVSATLMRNPRGEPLYYVCQFFDLTRRNEAQERLAANEAKLAEAQQLARLGSWEWEIATDTVVWSDELYRIYGVRPDRFPGSYGSYLDKVHPDDRARVARVIETAVAERRSWSLDYRVNRPDGEIRMIHARGEVVLDDHGRPAIVRGTAQDVTESRRVEDALRAAEQLFRRAFDDAPIGMALIDLEGRWLRMLVAADQHRQLVSRLHHRPFAGRVQFAREDQPLVVGLDQQQETPAVATASVAANGPAAICTRKVCNGALPSTCTGSDTRWAVCQSTISSAAATAGSKSWIPRGSCAGSPRPNRSIRSSSDAASPRAATWRLSSWTSRARPATVSTKRIPSHGSAASGSNASSNTTRSPGRRRDLGAAIASAARESDSRVRGRYRLHRTTGRSLRTCDAGV